MILQSILIKDMDLKRHVSNILCKSFGFLINNYTLFDFYI